MFTYFTYFIQAGKPKKQFALECLAIMLGPDYLSDIIEVSIYIFIFFKFLFVFLFLFLVLFLVYIFL